MEDILLCLVLLVAGFAGTLGQYTSDNCDWTIWDTTKGHRGVRHIFSKCSEGHVDWKHPYGAVRITFQLRTGKADLRACFKAKAHFTVAKISVERHQSLRTLVTLNSKQPYMQREICLDSATGENSVTLYMEADTNLNSTTIGLVELDYDLQRTYHRLTYDALEECRPCTDSELLLAACSNDFVVKGSIENLFHDLEAEETEVRLKVNRVVRQRGLLFKRTTASYNYRVGSRDLYTQGQYHGAVVAPQKCGIQHGEGDFMFMGQVRLGRAILQCAPRLEDFEHVWQKAVKQSMNPCILE